MVKANEVDKAKKELKDGLVVVEKYGLPLLLAAVGVINLLLPLFFSVLLIGAGVWFGYKKYQQGGKSNASAA